MGIRFHVDRARALRAQDTRAESKLWSKLSNRKLDGFKFRRQFPIQGYIADFCCIDAKLIVELDGAQHAEQVEYDAKRTAALQRYGFHVLRFWNRAVLCETDSVIDSIQRALHAGSLSNFDPLRWRAPPHPPR